PHAVHAGFGPARCLDRIGKAERAAMGAHDFQQLKQAQAGAGLVATNLVIRDDFRNHFEIIPHGGSAAKLDFRGHP
ncbi:hypothetical protein, partial [Escherichia coli]|uniref:hypothetical protein n=1 Tax=Escherichia coli TaxID=562 RepID=UPI00201D91DB